MALHLSSHLSLLSRKPLRLFSTLRPPSPSSLSFPSTSSSVRRSRRTAASPASGGGEGHKKHRKFPSRKPREDDDDEEESSGETGEDPDAPAARIPDEWGEKAEPEPEAPAPADPPKDEDEWGRDPAPAARIPDEWGEKAEPEPEAPAEADPPKDEDEWGRDPGNGSSPVPPDDDRLGDLKRCLVDTFYGTDYGLRASVEVRAEVLELVSQLEAENPTPVPTEATELLDGNWILLYTAFSELLPLIAVGTIPLLKVKRISQVVDTKSLTIVNATTLSSPFATFSFSASASFEVQSPSRIQVRFKEGTIEPPAISTSVDLPENVDLFGQKIDLLPVQRTLNPIQEAVANIARVISGQPPLKVPIPGDRSTSWLLTTYLDKDLRISRGDGGLFVLAKEGSPLLDQLS